MKNILFAIVCFAFISSCGRGSGDNTPQETLPPATQTGANTAGCYVNGILLLPKNGSQAIGGSPKYGLKANSFSGGYYFYIQDYTQNRYLFIYLPDVTSGTGNYTINQSNGIDTPAGNQDQNQMYLYFDGKEFISSTNCGTLNLTKYSFPIISATFSATLYNKANPSETIHITEGRLDINKNTLNQ